MKLCEDCIHFTYYLWMYESGVVRRVDSCREFHHLELDGNKCDFYERKEV